MNKKNRTVNLESISSIEAEAGVLGSMIIDLTCIPSVLSRLPMSESFFFPEHQIIYEALLSLYFKNTPIDAISLRTELIERKKLKEIGGVEYIAKILNSVPSSANAGYYAGIVRAKEKERKVQAAIEKIISVPEQPGNVDEMIQQIQSIALALEPTSRGPDFIELKKEATIVATDLRDNKVDEILTGYRDIDWLINGYYPGEFIIIAARPSMGKAQPLDSKVLTINGYKLMSKLEIGDSLASIDGNISNLLAIYPQGEKQIYKITFSDGRSTECCGEHLWRINYRTWEKSRILNTYQLIEKIKKTRFQKRLWIDVFEGIYGNNLRLPINPWVMGVLLSEGTLCGSTVRVTTPDKEIIDKLKINIEDNLEIVKASGKYQYRIKRKGGANRKGISGVLENPLKIKLKKLNLWGKHSHEKFIPDIYKYINREMREQLLAGLIDTDGWVEKFGSIRISTSSEQLAKDIIDLIRSIGGTGTYYPKQSIYKINGKRKKGRIAYICNLQHPHAKKIVTLRKKYQRIRKDKKRLRRLNIISIEPTRVTQTQCIKVSHPSQLYITDDYIVTHNSALALDMSIRIAGRGTPVYFASLEMTTRAMIERAICSNAGVDMARLRSGEAGDDEWDEVYRQSMSMENLEILFSSKTNTPEQFAGMVHRLKQTHKIGIAFIDYIQLMYTAKKSESRQHEISVISQMLKRIALRENIPIVAISQLNRQVDSRENHRPRMSDLRDSGSLEQDADIVQFIYREDEYRKNEPGFEPTGVAEIITEKNRRGRTGVTKLVFVHDFARFSDMARV